MRALLAALREPFELVAAVRSLLRDLSAPVDWDALLEDDDGEA